MPKDLSTTSPHALADILMVGLPSVLSPVPGEICSHERPEGLCCQSDPVTASRMCRGWMVECAWSSECVVTG